MPNLSNSETFNSLCRKKMILSLGASTMSLSYGLNFFNNRNTNANDESFNAKMKLLRADLRGVTDTTFFLFRLHKLFA